MLGYFNRTHSELDGTWDLFAALMNIEIFLIVFSMIKILFWFFIILTAKNMHRNVRCINSFYYGQYVIALGFWACQPVIILMGLVDDTDKFSNNVFTLCSYVRIIGIFYAFCALPALVIERTFATFFLEDYEKSPNALIGNSIVLIQWIIAIGLGTHFNRAESTVEHTVGAIIANTLAVILNKFNEKMNSKYYYEADRITYSLSERFQITENIKTAKTFEKIVLSIGFFNIIVNSCLILDNYPIPMTLKNIASISCDFSILLYGLIVPVVYYNQTESWRRRVRNVLKGCNNPPQVVPLRDTFGHEMTAHGARQETARYFEMLKDQWK